MVKERKMPSGKQKSRSRRRIFRKIPGNTVVLHYRNRNPRKASCADCGATLQGVASARKAQMQNMPKTMKRPERPFAGVLCSSCSRAKHIAKARTIISP